MCVYSHIDFNGNYIHTIPEKVSSRTSKKFVPVLDIFIILSLILSASSGFNVKEYSS